MRANILLQPGSTKYFVCNKIKKQDSKVKAQAEGSKQFDSSLLITGQVGQPGTRERNVNVVLGVDCIDRRYRGLNLDSRLYHVLSFSKYALRPIGRLAVMGGIE